MKNLGQIIFFVVFLLSGTFAFAQTGGSVASATAATTVIIVHPLKIENRNDLHFGEIASPLSEAIAVVSPAGAESGTVTWADKSLITAASFDVTGEANHTVYITLPSVYTVTNGADAITIYNFVSNHPAGVFMLNADGMGRIDVGATLRASANQDVGTYTNPNGLEVSISY